MKITMTSKDNRNEYGDISRALCVAYSEKKAVLVTQFDKFVCVFIPNHDDYTIEITEDGIDLVRGEFVDFDNGDIYNWEDCIFEVIETDNIDIIVTRD